MIISASVEINAPMSVVWNTFAHMEKWDEWNTACRGCCILSGDEGLSADTCFSFVIRPLAFPLKVQPKIVKCDPGKEVVWEGGRMGINASHTWQFRQENGKVLVLSVERFKGPTMWVGHLLNVPNRLHKLTEDFLQALKHASESCAT